MYPDHSNPSPCSPADNVGHDCSYEAWLLAGIDAETALWTTPVPPAAALIMQRPPE